MLCLPYYAYVFSSTKLEIRAEQVLPRSKEGREEWVGQVAGGKKCPNNVFTCE
jgi:hypothetical protein